MSSAGRIRESEAGGADRQVVNVTAVRRGWQWLGMAPAHEWGLYHDIHDVVPTPDRRAGQSVDGNSFGTMSS